MGVERDNAGMAGAYLDRRYASPARRAWTWIARYRVDDTAVSETIGYWTTEARDPWRPRAYKGRQLPRINEATARARLHEIDAALLSGKGGRAAPTPWEEWVEEVEGHNAGTVAPTTLVDYVHALKLFGELTGCMAPRAVDVAMAKRFTQAASGSGRSVATVNKYLAALCRIWNSEFPRLANPFRAVRSEREGGLRRGRIAEQDWHRVTPAELRKLLGVCTQRWQVMVLLAYTAGLRKAEIENLTWADVDLDGLLVAVNPKRDTATTWAWTPKDHERRTLPLTPEVKLALLRLRNPAVPYVVIDKPRYAKLLKDRRKTGRDVGREVHNNFDRAFKAACRRAGVPVVAFHWLRKTCITNWLESGARGARVEPHEVQKLAGHSSIQTTMRYYAQVAREALDRARRASVTYVGKTQTAG